MELKEWLRCYKSALIVLLEPRISGAGASNVCKRIGKSHWIMSEANGFNGGRVYFGMRRRFRSSYWKLIGSSYMFLSARRECRGGYSPQSMQAHIRALEIIYGRGWMSYTRRSPGCF